MKRLVLGLVTSLVAASAAEPVRFPLQVGTLKMRDGTVLEDARILGRDAVGVKIMHSGGMARVAFNRLPKELAEKFPGDSDAAREQLEEEARKEMAHDRAVDRTLTKRANGKVDGGSAPGGRLTDDGAIEEIPRADGDPEVKIASLEAYIHRLESGIQEATETAAEARRRAEGYRSSATTQVNQADGRGGMFQRTVVNRSRLRRAEFQIKRAEREDSKIERARVLIDTARETIAELKRSARK